MICGDDEEHCPEKSSIYDLCEYESSCVTSDKSLFSPGLRCLNCDLWTLVYASGFQF